MPKAIYIKGQGVYKKIIDYPTKSKALAHAKRLRKNGWKARVKSYYSRYWKKVRYGVYKK